jgi:transcription elongation factor Elf1
MTIRFACPNCGVTGSADASAVGKLARCKYCGHRFAIPAPGAVEPADYSLEEPAEATAGAGDAGMDSVQDEALTTARGAPPVRAGAAQPGRSPGNRPMTIRFACPNCGVTGSVDGSAAGKLAHCKYCAHRFNIPIPGAEPEPAVYSLEEPVEETGGAENPFMDPFQDSTFATARGDEPTNAAPRWPERQGSPTTTPKSRQRASRSPWPARLALVGIALAIAIAATALFAPNGLLIAACAAIALGCVMILLGYAVGAYGAFSEDVIYGILYLVIPLYTAYYMVTRWDDLWVWFVCMTLGVGLILLGIEMARWGGVFA